MRNLLLLISMMLFLFTTLINGQETWVSFNGPPEGEADLTIQSSNSAEVVFTINLPGMYVHDEMGYQRLRVQGAGRTDSTGFPELPLLKYLAAVPLCDSVIFTIQPLDSIILDNYNVYPAPELVEQTAPEGYTYLAEQFTKNDSIYGVDDFYPSDIAEIFAQGFIRDQGVSEVHLQPVKFNPVQQKIKVYFSLQVNLTFVNPVSEVNVETGIFNGVCYGSLINYNPSGVSSAININSSLPGTVERLTDKNTHNVICDYLIISANSLFNNSLIDTLAIVPLILCKKAKKNRASQLFFLRKIQKICHIFPNLN